MSKIFSRRNDSCPARLRGQDAILLCAGARLSRTQTIECRGDDTALDAAHFARARDAGLHAIQAISCQKLIAAPTRSNRKGNYTSMVVFRLWNVNRRCSGVQHLASANHLEFRIKMAERVGFEPTVRFPAHTLSKRAP